MKTKEQAEEEARYQKELTEVRDKLPQELKEYADVFCKKRIAITGAWPF